MNLCFIFAIVIAFFPEEIECASFNWDTVSNGQGMGLRSGSAYQTTTDGTIHLFWIKFNMGGRGMLYQTIRPDGTLVNKTYIDFAPKSICIYSVSAQVTDDGKYVLVVFDGTLKAPKTDGAKKTIFFESSNGGESWSEPALVQGTMDDKIARLDSKVLLEKDTGRVFIVYRKVDLTQAEGKYSLELCTREPGAKSFGQPIRLPDVAGPHPHHIGQTIEKSQKYLHVIARSDGEGLMHARSNDGGRTWSKFTFIYKMKLGPYLPTITMNSKVNAGGLYVLLQDGKKKNLVIWSRDHGISFQAPIPVGDNNGYSNLLSLCGTKDKSLLFTAHQNYYVEESYIKFTILHSNSFTSIPYPFKNLKNGQVELIVLSCRYEKEGQYSVILAAADMRMGTVWIARGTLKGV